MKVDISVGEGHPSGQIPPVTDFVMINCTDAAWMNVNLAYIVVPMLKCLKQFKQGVDRSLIPLHSEEFAGQLLFDFVGTDEEREYALELGEKRWHEFVDKMIYAFEQYIITGGSHMDDPRVEEGLRLFGQHYDTLWN